MSAKPGTMMAIKQSLDINLSGIILLTGNPGAGKTLRMIEYLHKALASGRPCFACNVNGLNVPGVIEFEDPRKWRELPPGAVLFLDEGQRFFRTRRGNVEAPDYIKDMETIRHDSVCIVITTQKPTYLDKHLRGLVGHHEHLVEMVASYQSNVYTFRECCEELSDSDRAAAGYKVWMHPRKLHGSYISAEVHTKKAFVPKRLLVLGIATLAVVGFVVWAFFLHDPKADQMQGDSAPAVRLASNPGGATKTDTPPPLSPTQYAQKHAPRFASMPWTAEAFDHRQPTSDPLLMCMSSIGGTDADGHYKAPSCTCLTEQGTAYDIGQPECRRVARLGMPYNPYRTTEPSQALPASVEVASMATREPSLIIDPAGEVGATASRPMVDRTYGTITRPSL